MRNLRQLSHEIHQVKHVAQCCYHEDKLLAASIADGFVKLYQVEPVKKQLATFDAPEIAPGVADSIVNIHHDIEQDSVSLILLGGDIVIVSLGAENSVEIIGTIDQNVLAAQWSPDGDVVAIITEGSVSLLTSTFESISETPIVDTDIKASAAQISVGWGRSETQFRGKHAPRDPTLPESIDEGTLSPDDDGRVNISWRGDGLYFCISTVSLNRRIIRVYSREGILESTSEPVNNHESVVSWKPTGAIICSVQKLPSARQCIFFEKNGLRHGEFTLRREERVIDLQWNCDSTVLAAVYTDGVDLYTSSNYHYSLKARLTGSDVKRIAWHTEQPFLLSIVCADEVLSTEWSWTIATSRPEMPFDYGLTAMIDGTSLGLTPLRLANVPPPMSFRTLHTDDVPRAVALEPRTNQILILLSRSVECYVWDLALKPAKSPASATRFPLVLETSEEPMQIQAYGQLIYILTSNSRLLVYTDGSLCRTIQCKKNTQLFSILSDDILMHCKDGSVWHHTNGTARQLCTLPEPCHTIEAHVIDGLPTLIGLAKSGKLYANTAVIATKITSFLSIDGILAATSTNFLKFAHIRGELSVPTDDVVDERSRQIDRGSLLVCSCPSSESIILQAPRGNLETVYPRLLVLNSIREALTSKDWALAWRKAKVHRIDTNIMYDHNPDLFLLNVRQFVEDLKTSTELDLFLSVLKAEDVSQAMYRNTLITEEVRQPRDNKVNAICERVLEVLTASFSETHMSSILTAHLSKDPADYSAALQLVSSQTGIEKEASITHVCFLADPHLLYNHALGQYDLPLALLFAQRSQKDPREYVPFLQGIQKMDKLRQKFTLNDYLNKSEQALSFLLQIESAWDESTAYIQRHKLWSIALQLLRHDRDRLHKLYALYAEALFAQQEYAEAGLTYELVANYTRAAEAFERAALWREALHATVMDKGDVLTCAARLAKLMEDQHKYSQAAIIHKDHLSDIDTAIDMHCRAFEFSQAILLSTTQSRLDNHLKPGLTQSFVSTSELLSEMQSQLKSQIPRLSLVRQKRAENPEGYLDGAMDDETPDNVSLAGTSTTTASIFTRYTGTTGMTNNSKRSSKARRRTERQRARGKQGTIWEEEYLVNSIRRLTERLEATRPDARALCIGLVRCEMREQATEIQRQFKALVTYLWSVLDDVFSGIQTLPLELQRSMGEKPELKELESLSLC